jgi:hypothetical protein
VVPIDSDTRRAALIATAVTVPLVIVVGLLLGGAGSSGPDATPTAGAALPAVTVSAPTSTDAATVAVCAQVISALPLRLAGQNVRGTVSTPPSPSIVAWGNPAIVLRCGVTRPKTLVPGSSVHFYSFGKATDDPYYDVTTSNGANVYTTVDRAVYVEVSIPATYTAAPIVTVSTAIAKVLPSVCSVDASEPDTSKLCTRRK